ncbi:PIR protein [Plasmodium yoelii]|uniref:PIR protein n=2 Tax=Plasmodium yoelii TaxID=5861 RepID=A0AAE9WLC7_PLAYO|nr:PIR protein [Plasmodium yoelii]WBY54650.1 PIR protein [Plasmodium yoelii yoelii]CDU16019.1 YIR protein [Plasmodium yoelii]VTZ71643.1 PIR protein [Plasmodium yoelii]|eukprot:XP_022810968.1 PIR protein [Plasmodium yoelii]
MDYRMCLKFDNLSKYLPDELNGTTSLDINKLGNVQNYCSNGESEGTGCKTNLDKINGGCLWLFEQNIINNIDSLSKDQFKFIIIYIMIWLSYMLDLNNDEKINNLNDFYTQYIENNTHYNNCKKNNNNYDDCSSSLKDKTGYNNFKDFIEKNEYLKNIGINMSNFYDAFKSLCNMYTELDASNTKCEKCLENAKEFVKKYNELNKNPNITKDSPYYQVLSTLSNDYNNFKNYCDDNSVDCNDIPSLSSINTKENSVQSSAHNHVHNSGVTSSSSSVTNKLIPVLSIIIAIPIFFGIFYKYSLFGFRKRSQKQHLREKLNNK